MPTRHHPRRATRAAATLAALLALPVSAAVARHTSAVAGGPPLPVQAPALYGAAPPISPRDRVYTADQTSNTITVINPATNRVLGTIPLGDERIGHLLSPLYFGQANVHGLGFSRDGRLLDVIDVTTNAVVLINTATNHVVRTFYVGRAPHEGFISPDGRQLWVAVRGQDYVAVLDIASGREVDRIQTEPGPSKVVFSPDGSLAYVNHERANALDVIDVASRRIVARITGLAGAFSSDEAISPDGKEVWAADKMTGETTVVDAVHFRVLAILHTGPGTNHPNFVSTRTGDYAYVTVGDTNETLVYRRDGAHPVLVTRIQDTGADPHGIWPSPDNTRIYVALEKAAAVDVIDTATMRVTATLHVGEGSQALVYVANAVPQGAGRQGLTRQGLNKRTMTLTAPVRGTGSMAEVTVSAARGLDQIDVAAAKLPPGALFTVYGVLAADSRITVPLMDVTTTPAGKVEDALAFTRFFGVYSGVVIAPTGQPV